MSTEQTFVVLDTNRHIEVLIRASMRFTKPDAVMLPRLKTKYHADGTVETSYVDEPVAVPEMTPLTHRRAMEITTALVDEVLSQFLHYRTRVDPNETIARALFDTDTIDDVMLAVTDMFLCVDEVDSLVLDINTEMKPNLTNPWRQWDLIRTPTLLGLLGGIDYRIAEWERNNGHHYDIEDGEAVVRVDVSSLVNFLQIQIQEVLPISKKQVVALLADGLSRIVTHVDFTDNAGMPYLQIEQSGMSYESFFYNYLKQPIESFTAMFLSGRCDHYRIYRGDLTETELRFYLGKGNRSEDESRYLELKEAEVRGDWIPESDRRWMAEYK